jgi:hypothetical protein
MLILAVSISYGIFKLCSVKDNESKYINSELGSNVCDDDYVTVIYDCSICTISKITTDKDTVIRLDNLKEGMSGYININTQSGCKLRVIVCPDVVSDTSNINPIIIDGFGVVSWCCINSVLYKIYDKYE